ncbi:lipoyl(octanoyl) transferase LipB [Buchnera aphidicola]|uniref:lipoyl(octanoyl) transferase LipB n=1 Tax=Buchnera aphidicola TaxID=9 RepID=UPI0030ED4A0D
MKKKIIVRNYSLIQWNKTFNLMHNFINKKCKNDLDEIWFVEHYPIYTQGLKNSINKKIHKNIKNISVVSSDRGGDITFHGPGQQTIYFLINLIKNKITVKKFLKKIIQSTINSIAHFSIKSYYLKKYPGIYIKNKKVCSMGFKIKKGHSLHGISINIFTDLKYFKYIKPCGNKFLIMENLSNIVPNITLNYFKRVFLLNFLKIFNYKIFNYIK